MRVRVNSHLLPKLATSPRKGDKEDLRDDCEICKRVIPSGIDLRPILTRIETALHNEAAD